MEVKLKNKSLYKLEIGLLKFIPGFVALIYLLNVISSYYGIDLPILSHIGGFSFITVLFMYISSYVFKFCSYHRMFLHYIVVSDCVNLYDYYIGIPISTQSIITLDLSIAGIFLFVIVFLYLRKKRNDKCIKETSSSNS